MNANSRAAIAYIAGRLLTGYHSKAVFDYSQSKYLNIRGTVAPGIVQVFDYEDGAHISGSGNGTTFSLFHYGEGSHISLVISNPNFKGFDYGTGSHFQGSVQGTAVQLYDFSSGQYYQFQIIN
jgi:hypothetical protein